MKYSSEMMKDFLAGRDEIPNDEIYAEIDRVKILMDEAYERTEKEEWNELLMFRENLKFSVWDNLKQKRVDELNGRLYKKAKPKHIEVDAITPEEGSVTIKLMPGITQDDLKALWDEVIKELNLHNMTAIDEKNRDQQIVLDRRLMMTFKQIADKYFPDEIDRNASIDKVKKIYKRNSGRDWRGTTPWGDKFIP